MSEPTPTVLRETKIGQKGFIKEDVITYLDELNSKIVALEEDNKALKEKGGQADPEEINKYKTQIENLQEKLNTSNNALRAAKKENEELQNTINQLKAQGGGQQAAVALEAAKKEIDTLKEKLKAAEQKAAAGAANPQANAQTTAALEAAKKEIEDLRNRLKAAEQKAASAGAAPAGGAADAELAKAKQEIIKISDELTAKTKEIAELTGKLEAKTKEAAEKTAEISKLNDEIVDLKENAAPTFDMGALFTEAQKNVTQIQNKAKKDAEAVTKEANDKAAQVIKDANIEAEKAVANANVAAEACIKEANEQARNTVNEANAHADKVNAMSKTVREMLLTEIESINSKFTDIASVLNNLTGQCSGRMNEAQNIIGEARKAVDTQKNDGVVKRSDPPRAEFKPSKAPRAKVNEAKSDDAGINKNNNNNFNNNNKPAQQNNQPAAQNQQNKPAQGGNKSANFNFDMAELLKAAEEEAAKEGEN
jgi:chromosome segregation ATPase